MGEGSVGYRNPAEEVVEFFSHACSKYRTQSLSTVSFLQFKMDKLQFNMHSQHLVQVFCFCRMNYTVRVGSYISIQVQTLNPLSLAILYQTYLLSH